MTQESIHNNNTIMKSEKKIIIHKPSAARSAERACRGAAAGAHWLGTRPLSHYHYARSERAARSEGA